MSMASRPLSRASRTKLATITFNHHTPILLRPSSRLTHTQLSTTTPSHRALPPHRSLHTTPTLRFDPEPSTLTPPDYLSAPERAIFTKLQTQLTPTKLEVQDISGGCGSMYGIEIVSSKFAGLSVMKQHRLVNEVLREEIKGWHGVQLKTKAP